MLRHDPLPIVIHMDVTIGPWDRGAGDHHHRQLHCGLAVNRLSIEAQTPAGTVFGLNQLLPGGAITLTGGAAPFRPRAPAAVYSVPLPHL